MMMILSGAWPQATACLARHALPGPQGQAGVAAGHGLREIQGRESSGGAASRHYVAWSGRTAAWPHAHEVQCRDELHGYSINEWSVIRQKAATTPPQKVPLSVQGMWTLSNEHVYWPVHGRKIK